MAKRGFHGVRPGLPTIGTSCRAASVALLALIHIVLAVCSTVPLRASASVAAHHIITSTAVLTDAFRTLVDVCRTMRASVLRRAGALEGRTTRYCPISARSAVRTRVVRARSDFNLAIRALVTSLTFARVFGNAINTMPVITAHTCCAVIDVVVAVHPIVTGGASARVRPRAGLGASSVIAQIRIFLAFVCAFLTVFTGPSVLAVARILLVVWCHLGERAVVISGARFIVSVHLPAAKVTLMLVFFTPKIKAFTIRRGTAFQRTRGRR